MPKIIRAIEDYADPVTSRHHGGGIMMRGGFDIEEAEVSMEEYVRRLVSQASSDMAYRKWKKLECINLGPDNRFYLFCDAKSVVFLCRVGMIETLTLTDNYSWRQEARKWIADNYADDPLEDRVLSEMLRKHGEQL